MTTVLLASFLGSLWTVAAVLDAPPSSYLLAWFGIVLALIDLRHHRLPDALTLPLGAALLLLQSHRLGEAALGALVFGGAHLAVRRLRPEFMGGGDVKLAAALGTTLSLPSLLPAAILASAVTLAIAAVKRTRKVPHGPGLLAATWALTTL
ncbi:A24 family peptidase [Lentzea sp. NPDC006480]|uniref:A24 family peptidase n=1 Tax=Lentzea sp. NPDC006480 TaxID=3157176 RepID=UPI0033B74573